MIAKAWRCLRALTAVGIDANSIDIGVLNDCEEFARKGKETQIAEIAVGDRNLVEVQSGDSVNLERVRLGLSWRSSRG